MKVKLTKGIILLIGLIIFIILLVSFLKIGFMTSKNVETSGIKVDCAFKQGVCLEPVDNQCPDDISYTTIENTDCEQQNKICCVE